MVKGSLKAKIPNNHGSDINGAFIDRIIKQAGISRDEWNEAGRN